MGSKASPRKCRMSKDGICILETCRRYRKPCVANKKCSSYTAVTNKSTYQRNIKSYTTLPSNSILTNGTETIKALFIATRDGKITWKKVSPSIDSSRNVTYRVTFNGVKYSLYATSYKRYDKEMIALRLNLEVGNNVLSNFTQQYNQEIYRAIIKELHKQEQKNKSVAEPTKSQPTKAKRRLNIHQGDFVIRTNLFRCFYEDHEVEEIIGYVKVLNRMGKEEIKKIPCAYCEKCKCFFMLTSEYKVLSKSGIILCQLIDSKDYYEHNTSSSYYGANASLLMLNGYNVKANNGLTDLQRVGILKSIIDNGIMSPHKIVSYLDFFISQKQNNLSYRDAIDKWTHDRNFVINYQNNNKREVEIERIRK